MIHSYEKGKEQRGLIAPSAKPLAPRVALLANHLMALSRPSTKHFVRIKKIVYLLVVFSYLFSACSKEFLEKVPESTVTTGNFYKTEAQFEQALVGAYAAVRSVKGSIAAWTMAEMRADNTFYEYNVNNRGLAYQQREDIDGFLDDNANDLISGYYNSSYVGIARANSILGAIAVSELNQEVVNRFVGEAKFIRALLYFDLVRFYGGVPLYLEAVTSAESAYIPRSTVEQTYAAIEADLSDAVAKLSSTSFPQNGRASKGAARTLLGDVYLAQKKYDLAEAEFLSVTQLGYDLLPNYASVYELSNKNSRESIFELQFQQGNQGQQSNFLYPFLPLAEDVSLITGITSQNRQGGGWNIPTQEFIESYETGDERLDASIAVAEGTGPIGSMIIESVKSPVGYTTTAGKRSYAFIKKYLHQHSLENNTDDDFPVYRYAEVLLSLAETLNEQNRSGEALPYLNKVRRRAGLGDIGELDKTLLRDIIAHERRVELAFENKRWTDLLRTGKALEVMQQNGVYLKLRFNNLLPQSYQVTAQKLVYAIPQREVLIGGLAQNPGYE
ncbi:MAG: RagB/SusD family nutrient uptake outer membrane protein [Chitinophagaceae bacterium]|nr:RagB/SusD family nutrient uptake outer membrane protein [Chitinophagaceae bacterium]